MEPELRVPDEELRTAGVLLRPTEGVLLCMRCDELLRTEEGMLLRLLGDVLRILGAVLRLLEGNVLRIVEGAVLRMFEGATLRVSLPSKRLRLPPKLPLPLLIVPLLPPLYRPPPRLFMPPLSLPPWFPIPPSRLSLSWLPMPPLFPPRLCPMSLPRNPP